MVLYIQPGNAIKWSHVFPSTTGFSVKNLRFTHDGTKIVLAFGYIDATSEATLVFLNSRDGTIIKSYRLMKSAPCCLIMYSDALKFDSTGSNLYITLDYYYKQMHVKLPVADLTSNTLTPTYAIVIGSDVN